MMQYCIFHPRLGNKFVLPKKLEYTGPSHARELIFSESDGKDSYFELIPVKGKQNGPI